MDRPKYARVTTDSNGQTEVRILSGLTGRKIEVQQFNSKENAVRWVEMKGIIPGRVFYFNHYA